MKRFAIAMLLPPLVAPALLMLVLDFGRNMLSAKHAYDIAQFLFFGGVFTYLLSLPYAALLEICYSLTKARPGSAGGVIAAIGLGFGAGAVVALSLAHVLTWDTSLRLGEYLHMLALFGGIGTAVGTLVAALIFVLERSARVAG
jgi:hypothetical protein